MRSTLVSYPPPAPPHPDLRGQAARIRPGKRSRACGAPPRTHRPLPRQTDSQYHAEKRGRPSRPAPGRMLPLLCRHRQVRVRASVPQGARRLHAHALCAEQPAPGPRVEQPSAADAPSGSSARGLRRGRRLPGQSTCGLAHRLHLGCSDPLQPEPSGRTSPNSASCCPSTFASNGRSSSPSGSPGCTASSPSRARRRLCM